MAPQSLVVQALQGDGTPGVKPPPPPSQGRTGRSTRRSSYGTSCTAQSKAGTNRGTSAGSQRASRHSLSWAASGSGSPELIPEDALRGEPEAAQYCDNAIRAEARQAAVVQMQAEAQQWAKAEHDACEEIFLKEGE